MTDIVRILEKYCTDKGYIFHYGRQHVLNLIDTASAFSGDANDIYMLLEYRKGRPLKKGLVANEMKYEGLFYICKQSDLDQNFKAEVGEDATSKYTVNIEPLITLLNGIDTYFACSLIEYTTLEFDDVTDFLDGNMDGVMVKFSATVPNSFSYDTASS